MTDSEKDSLIAEYKAALKEFQKVIDELETDLETQSAELAKKTQEIFEYQTQIGEKSRIVVSRLWHNPAISVEYNYHGARIYLNAEDYIKALVDQATIDNKPTGWKKYVNLHYPTKDQIEKWFIAASEKIIAEMKNATVYFPPPIVK